MKDKKCTYTEANSLYVNKINDNVSKKMINKSEQVYNLDPFKDKVRMLKKLEQPP